MKTLLKILTTVPLILVWSSFAFGQSCVTSDEVKAMISQVNSPRSVPLNKKLRNELLKLEDKTQELLQQAIGQPRQAGAVRKRLDNAEQKNGARLCGILKEFGWPTINLVGREGADAALFLLQNSQSFQFQIDLLPVIVAAVKRNEIDKPHFAALFDRMRGRAGMKQFFGTQASVVNGFLVLDPIEAESQVDSRRSQLGLPPLAEYLKSLERVYRAPLVKSPTAPMTSSARPGLLAKSSLSSLVPQIADEGEVIRIDTNLVSLNVSVYSDKLKTHVSTLGQQDFKVFEDGHEQTVAFFASTDVPFDLVLLIDLSGSTSDKRDLIRNSTKRFLEAARHFDRLAIVTFSDLPNVVSPLTEDHAKLLESLDKIDGTGNSNVWDALKFTLDEVVGPKSLERRRAVVLMSDGVDNALGSFGSKGSTISFAELVETVRHNDTMIIPIYLDTESDPAAGGVGKNVYENARKTLALLAEESGGLYYKARKIADLNGIYEQVMNDVGKVYSLGYKPTNDKRDGLWRAVRVQIPNRPELTTRTRPGYYAN